MRNFGRTSWNINSWSSKKRSKIVNRLALATMVISKIIRGTLRVSMRIVIKIIFSRTNIFRAARKNVCSFHVVKNTYCVKFKVSFKENVWINYVRIYNNSTLHNFGRDFDFLLSYVKTYFDLTISLRFPYQL